MKDKILEFIQSYDSNTSEIISVMNKDYDDEDGYIDEHYIVTVKRKIDNREYKQECLVDKSVLKQFHKKHNGVKWLKKEPVPQLNYVMNTFSRSLEKHSILAPGEYEGYCTAYFLKIKFDNGRFSEEMEMDSGVRGFNIKCDVCVDEDGWVIVL